MQIKNLELTKEQRALLKKCSPINLEKTFEYVPAAYRLLPIELRPVFTLQPVSGLAIVEDEDLMNGQIEIVQGESPKINIHRGKFTAGICRRGVVSWKNYRDFETDEEIKFNIEALPKDLAYEIADVVLRSNELTEEEKLGLK